MTSNLVGEVIKMSSDLIDAPLYSHCLPLIWLVVQFLCNSLQMAGRMDLKLGGWTHNPPPPLPRPDKTFVHAPLFPGLWLVKSLYGIPQAWLTFGHAPLNSNFLPFDLFSCFHAFAYKAYKPLDGLTSNLVDELIIGLI